LFEDVSQDGTTSDCLASNLIIFDEILCNISFEKSMTYLRHSCEHVQE